MKHFLFALAFIGTTTYCCAQPGNGIQFTDSSWSQLLAKAKREHKLIFMDAHTTWCGPCKWMSKNVFPDANVSALYNRNFINAYTDMEKGEGIGLRKKYAVVAYPTYLFINGDGEVVHRVVGQCTIPEFIKSGLDALNPKGNLLYFQTNAAANKMDYDFVSGYLNALEAAYQKDKANEIALAFLSQLKPVFLQERNNWELINKYVSDASSPVFKYVVTNQALFENLFGKEKVPEKIHETFLAWPQHYLQYPMNGKIILDEDGFNNFLAQVKKSDYNKKKEVIAKAKLTIYSGMKKWQPYIQLVSEMIDNKIIPLNPVGAEQIYFYTNLVYRFGKEQPAAINKAINVAKILAKKIPNINIQNKAAYLNLYANLLQVSGKEKEAAIVRKSINQQKLKEAQASKPFQQLQPLTPKSK